MGNEQSGDPIGFSPVGESQFQRNSKLDLFNSQYRGVEGRMMDKPPFRHLKTSTANLQSHAEKKVPIALPAYNNQTNKHISTATESTAVTQGSNSSAKLARSGHRRGISMRESVTDNVNTNSTFLPYPVSVKDREKRCKMSSTDIPSNSENRIALTTQLTRRSGNDGHGISANSRIRIPEIIMSKDGEKSLQHRVGRTKISSVACPESITETVVESKEAFPAPAGFEELSGLDLSHLSAEERMVILQVAARAKQIEQVEQEKIRNIEDEVALYSQNARKNVQTPSKQSTSNKKTTETASEIISSKDEAKARQRKEIVTQNSNANQRRHGERKQNKICYLCSKKHTNNKQIERDNVRGKSITTTSESSMELRREHQTFDKCSSCLHTVCSTCSVRSSLLAKGLLCILCAKRRELVAHSNLWLKPTEKNNLQRSQSADTSLTPTGNLPVEEAKCRELRSQQTISHPASGEANFRRLQSRKNTGKIFERRRSESDPTSRVNFRRDSWVKTSRGLSRKSISDSGNTEVLQIENTGKDKSLAKNTSTHLDDRKYTGKTVDTEKEEEKILANCSPGTPNSRRPSLTSALFMQLSEDEEVKKHSLMSHNSSTENRKDDGGGNSTASATHSTSLKEDNRQLSHKLKDTKQMRSDANAQSDNIPYTSGRIPKTIQSLETKPSNAYNNDHGSVRNDKLTFPRNGMKERLSSDAAQFNPTTDSSKICTSSIDIDKVKSAHSNEIPSSVNSLYLSSANSVLPIPTPKESPASKIPSAMPRKITERNSVKADVIKANPRITARANEPPKVLPRRSSLSTTSIVDLKTTVETGPAILKEDELDGTDSFFIAPAMRPRARELTESPKVNRPTSQNHSASEQYSSADHHYDMDENDTEGNFDHILPYSNENIELDFVDTENNTSPYEANNRLREDCSRDKENSAIAPDGIKNVPTQKNERKTTAELSAKIKGTQCRTIVNLVDIAKIKASSNEFSTSTGTNTDSSQIDVPSEKYTTDAREKSAENQSKRDKALSDSFMKSAGSGDDISASENNSQSLSHLENQTAPKYRRMPLPSTTSSSAYTIKQPTPGITTDINRKWQIDDELSDLNTDLQDFEEKMKANMRILSGEVTPTLLTESEDEEEILRSATASIPTFPNSSLGQGGFSSFQPQFNERNNNIRATSRETTRSKPKKLANMFMKRTTSTDSFARLLEQSESSPRASHSYSPMAYEKDIRTAATPPTVNSVTRHKSHSSVGNIPSQIVINVEKKSFDEDRRPSLPVASDSSIVRPTFSDPCDLRRQGEIQHHSQLHSYCSPSITVSGPSFDIEETTNTESIRRIKADYIQNKEKKAIESCIENNDIRAPNRCAASGVGILADGLAHCFSCGTMSTQAISSSSPMDVKTRIVSGATGYSPVQVSPKRSLRSVDSSTQVSPTDESHTNSFVEGGLTLSDLRKLKGLIEALNDTKDIDDIIYNQTRDSRRSGEATLTQSTMFSKSDESAKGIISEEWTNDFNIPRPSAQQPTPSFPFHESDLRADAMHYRPDVFASASCATRPDLAYGISRPSRMHDDYPIEQSELPKRIPINDRRTYNGFNYSGIESIPNMMNFGSYPAQTFYHRFPYDVAAYATPIHHVPSHCMYTLNRNFPSSPYDPLPFQSTDISANPTDWAMRDLYYTRSLREGKPITTQPRVRATNREDFPEDISQYGDSLNNSQLQGTHIPNPSPNPAYATIDHSQNVSPMSRDYERVQQDPLRLNFPVRGVSNSNNLRKCSSVPTALNSDQPFTMEGTRQGEIKEMKPSRTRQQFNDVATKLYDTDEYSVQDQIDNGQDMYNRHMQQYRGHRPSPRRTYQHDSEFSDVDYTQTYDVEMSSVHNIGSSNDYNFDVKSRQHRSRHPSTNQRPKQYRSGVRSTERAYPPPNSGRKDYLRQRRYSDADHYSPRCVSRSYSIQSDFSPNVPPSASRKSLPHPPDDDEYSWRYEQVKQMNKSKMSRSASNVPYRPSVNSNKDTCRLQQTIDDLDQEERELDLRLKYLEIGRTARRSTMNSISLHEDLMQSRNCNFLPKHSTRRNDGSVDAETTSDDAITNWSASSSSFKKRPSPNSISVYEFLSTDSGNELSARNAGARQSPFYSTTNSVKDSASADLQRMGPNSRDKTQGEIRRNLMTNFSVNDYHVAQQIPYDNAVSQSTGTDYQSRYRRRLQENDPVRITHRRRTSRDDNNSNVVGNQKRLDSQDDIGNQKYHPTYFAQQGNYRLPAPARFAGLREKNQTLINPKVNYNNIYNVNGYRKNPCSGTIPDGSSPRITPRPDPTYAELAISSIDKNEKQPEDHTMPRYSLATQQATERQIQQKRKYSQMKKLDSMEDDIRSVVSDSEAYHLGKETTNWFDKPEEEEE